MTPPPPLMVEVIPHHRLSKTKGSYRVHMDDKLLLLQIAFSIVADSSDYVLMSIDNRVDEVRRVFNQLEMLVEGKDERDTNKTCQ